MIIYKTTNLVNGKIYVGKSIVDSPSYLGSGRLIKRAIKKYGADNFHKEILERCDDESHLNVREIHWIRELNSSSPVGYNLAEGGNGGNTRKAFTDEQYRVWLENKSKAQTGKTGYWKGRNRPGHSEKMHAAHSSGAFGEYEWLKKKRGPRQKVTCVGCGKLVAKASLSRHQNGSYCKRG